MTGKRVRVRKARHASYLSCGHWVAVGGLIVSHNRGPWRCADCVTARLKIAGQAKRHGAAALPWVLSDEARRP